MIGSWNGSIWIEGIFIKRGGNERLINRIPCTVVPDIVYPW